MTLSGVFEGLRKLSHFQWKCVPHWAEEMFCSIKHIEKAILLFLKFAFCMRKEN